VQFLYDVLSDLSGHTPPFVDGMLGGAFMYLLIHVIGARWRLVRRKPDENA
jgi:hypothetical protein